MSLAVRWQDRARCAGAPDVFFDGNDTRRAKAYCAGCPVWRECLAYGLDEDHGVWGGLGVVERRRLHRLHYRLIRARNDPANLRDIRLLVLAGMAPERLGELVGFPVDPVEVRVPRRRRRKAS